MAGGSSEKTVLSKNVLQMKFMKRSALRIEKEQSQEELQREIDDEHWVLDLPQTQQKESKFVTETSCNRIQDLRFGRMSFRGFNPEVEKLMKQYDTQTDLAAAELKEREIAVDDEEMANRYTSLFSTISKKFSKKRERSSVDEDELNSNDSKSTTTNNVTTAKRKFIKPTDD